MKYKEPATLLEVRKIKEIVHQRMVTEGVDAFLERINRHADVGIVKKDRTTKKTR